MLDEKWTEIDGIRTRYFDEGGGHPIVFVHGGQYGGSGGSSAAIWLGTAADLAGEFRVVAPDRLGQGFTDNPPRLEDYTINASVAHTVALIRSLGIDRCHLVGHSRGGFVVTQIAIDHPDLVSGITLVSSGTLSPGFARNHIVHANANAVSVQAGIRQGYERYFFNKALVTADSMAETARLAGLPKIAAASAAMFDQAASSRYFVPSLQHGRVRLLRHLKRHGLACPAQLVWGLNDPTADPENGKILWDLFSAGKAGLELVVLNESGHFVYVEQRDAFARHLSGFVNGYLAGAR